MRRRTGLTNAAASAGASTIACTLLQLAGLGAHLWRRLWLQRTYATRRRFEAQQRWNQLSPAIGQGHAIQKRYHILDIARISIVFLLKYLYIPHYSLQHNNTVYYLMIP